MKDETRKRKEEKSPEEKTKPKKFNSGGNETSDADDFDSAASATE